MKKLLLLPLILLAVLSLTGCERYSWRQKLTITVETPAGDVTGSSVTQVRWSKKWIQAGGSDWDYDLTGEAVVVEVTPGRYLFALLNREADLEFMGFVAGDSIAGRRTQFINSELFDEVRDRRDRAAGVIKVPEILYPTMVTFEDITDPMSVKLVNPADLAVRFGPGMRLKSVTLEVTNEPVTEGVNEGVLEWLTRMAPTQFDGQRGETITASNRLANSLNADSFQRR